MKRRRPNPTLVHHGLARAARWHVVTLAGKPLADLYGGTLAWARRVAARIGRLAGGADVVLLGNRATPRRLADHPRTRVRSSSRRILRREPARRVQGRARNARRIHRNPGRPPIGALAQAQRVYKTFHGFGSARVERANMKPTPRALAKIGPVVRIDYLSNKWDRRRRRYTHDTKAPHPVLYAGADGSFHLHGGKLRVTQRGLEH